MVCSVCHGPAIFPGIIDPITGNSIIHDKKFTGFGTKGEEVMGLSNILKSWDKPLVEDIAKELGATCEYFFQFHVNIVLYLSPVFKFHTCSIVYEVKMKTNEIILDVPAPGPWDAFHIVDGRIVTGTNPASATETAEAILQVFKTL